LLAGEIIAFVQAKAVSCRHSVCLRVGVSKKWQSISSEWRHAAAAAAGSYVPAEAVAGNNPLHRAGSVLEEQYSWKSIQHFA
jgi:hypothetical protein